MHLWLGAPDCASERKNFNQHQHLSQTRPRNIFGRRIWNTGCPIVDSSGCPQGDPAGDSPGDSRGSLMMEKCILGGACYERREHAFIYSCGPPGNSLGEVLVPRGGPEHPLWDPLGFSWNSPPIPLFTRFVIRGVPRLNSRTSVA